MRNGRDSSSMLAGYGRLDTVDYGEQGVYRSSERVYSGICMMDFF